MPGRNRGRRERRWIVLNQSLSPAFVRMIGRLANILGPAEIWTGSRSVASSKNVEIRTLPAYDRTSVRGRARSWAAFSAVASARIVGLRRRPFVLAVTNPPSNPQIAWAASRLHGVRYGVLVWDLYPDHIVRLGMASATTPWVRGWRSWNRRVFESASCVVTLGPRMRDAIRGQSPAAEVHVIPNWADVEELRPIDAEHNPFAIEHGLVEPTVVMYSGNLGASHDLAPMLDAARAMRARRDVRFVIVGDGLGLEAIRRDVDGLENVILLPRQPWERLKYSLSAADVSVVAQAAGSEHLSVPSKTYPSLAVGSAIAAITSQQSDLADLVLGNHVGFVARETRGFIRQLESLIGDAKTLSETKRRARKTAETRYSEDAVVERWHRVLARAIET